MTLFRILKTMKRSILPWQRLANVFLFGILTFALPAPLECFAEDLKASAHGLLERIVPSRANDFIVEAIPADQGNDVFEIESKEGKIVIRGNNGVAVATALNWYLKYYCHCHVSLNGRQVKMPDSLPTVSPKLRMPAWAQSEFP